MIMKVFCGTLLTLVINVHNMRKSSECLIKFQLFLKALLSDKTEKT